MEGGVAGGFEVDGQDFLGPLGAGDGGGGCLFGEDGVRWVGEFGEGVLCIIR